MAKCSGLVPKSFMCSRPALPNMTGAKALGDYSVGINSIVFSRKFWMGLVLSLKAAVREPLAIFSKPAARTQLYTPPATRFLAR